jgi:hypothetical protein
MIWEKPFMKMKIVTMLLLGCSTFALHGQATSTASRRFDFQVGGDFVYDHSDYYQKAFKGAGGYSTLDFTPHFGAEIDFRQANSPVDSAYERTYEIGARYHRTYGRFSPYAKVLYGRGVFNFVFDGTVVANLAYNEYVFGGGTDYEVLPFLNVRADYEYQSWLGFQPNGLTPQVLSIGVAYHFPGGLAKGRHFK